MVKGMLSEVAFLHMCADLARFVEFESPADLKTAVEKLDRQDFKGSVVECVADVR